MYKINFISFLSDMKKYCIMIIFSLFIPSFLFAQNLEIIPKADPNENIGAAVESVAKPGEVWDQYNIKAHEYQKKNNLSAQMASGIFTWDTLLDYLVYLIKFLSQLGIFIGACFIVYAWYLYATSFMTSDASATSSWNKAIKNAIVGVLVITFSYAIMKAITAAFLT